MDSNVMTSTQLSVHFYTGTQEALLLESELGVHKVEKSDRAGYYLVDNQDYETLEGLKVQFGVYHAGYGEAVFFPIPCPAYL